MNLLVRFARDLRRLGSPHVSYTVAVLGVVAALEVLGRQSAGNDLQDLIALTVLAMLVALVGFRHRRVPLPWVTSLLAAARRLGARLRRSTFEIGLDLRGRPPVKRGTPPLVLAIGLALSAWAALAGLLAADSPHRLRELAVAGSYVAWLVALAALWAGLLLLSLLAAFLPWAMLHDACVAAHAGPGPRPRRREFWA